MIRKYADPEVLTRVAAEEFVHACREAILARGRFVVALSGGSTPKRLHGLLSAAPYRDYIQWDQVFVLFGDERFVPPVDEQSNERMARETLLSRVPIPAANIFGMYREGSPEEAAALYEEVVRGVLGEELAIDLTLLGMGPDGHTASLFPGRPSVHETERLVVAAKANMGVEDRITMTAPLLNKSREIHFLITGADKAPAVQRVIEGAQNWDETPTQAISRVAPHVKFFLDEAAAADLGPIEA